MNAQNYTQKSLEAIQAAQKLTIENQNQQIEQIHLLAALLKQENGLVPQLLQEGARRRQAFPDLRQEGCAVPAAFQNETIDPRPHAAKGVFLGSDRQRFQRRKQRYLDARGL